MIIRKVFLGLLFIALLVVLQVFVLDFINKVLVIGYIFWVLFYPYAGKKEDYLFLILSFILGLAIDAFENTGGINAFATVFIAYIRGYVLRVMDNRDREEDKMYIYFGDWGIIKVVMYIIIMVSIHVIILFSIQSFSINNILHTIKNIVYTIVSSAIIQLVFYVFIQNKSREKYS